MWEKRPFKIITAYHIGNIAVTNKTRLRLSCIGTSSDRQGMRQFDGALALQKNQGCVA